MEIVILNKRDADNKELTIKLNYYIYSFSVPEARNIKVSAWRFQRL